MKAIVANVLFGSILGCLSCANSVYAQSQTINPGELNLPPSPIISAKLLSSDKLPIVPQIINLVDRIFTVKKSQEFGFSVDRSAEIIFRDRFSLNLSQDRKLEKLPYTYRDGQGDLILGFQNTFWQSKSQKKYWGVTTIEHWGNNNQPKQKLDLAKLNYTNLAPSLPAGNSMLTVSGGGNENLAKETDTSREFEKFRGAISYHHGIGENVTVGTGFIYEDLLVGFTQLTHDSDRFPLKTTVSLLSKESGGVDFRSHLRFQPTDSFVVNYYHDEDKDKFDANWKIISGLSLIADGNSKQETLSTGIKVALKSEYMSISAKAALDGNNNLQWKLKSEIGGLKFAHSSTQKKSTSQLDLELIESETFGFQCSAFIKHEINPLKQNENQFAVWGTKLESDKKISPHKHLWSINLGYGSSSYGNGLIASGSIALKPNMLLKLSYEEISATSDDNKIKLQIGSK
ncbi:hypothetical protein I4641_05955 [Waterburya agarophytonicola K14]|uniref:DUF5723 domain-containing protein n=1 Tax=Waterburya agarophytonicola KI4 TaxID=2874699 RepID=A0A964BQJ8_9CYAN|nr:hypothetical protein [Waterburya agarophytonicola]MCC0176522.1 hypothetical protein [Waterburya agarophytonicola KI4]